MISGDISELEDAINLSELCGHIAFINSEPDEELTQYSSILKALFTVFPVNQDININILKRAVESYENLRNEYRLKQKINRSI